MYGMSGDILCCEIPPARHEVSPQYQSQDRSYANLTPTPNNQENMSTRANIHFVYGDSDRIDANIYRHSDGYPSGLGVDLHRFLDEVGKLNDTRFGDPEYLAAKFLVWQAKEYAELNNRSPYRQETTGPAYLNFLSVAPCIEDHGDIEYIYKVACSNGRPRVFVQSSRSGNGWKLIESAQAAEKM